MTATATAAAACLAEQIAQLSPDSITSKQARDVIAKARRANRVDLVPGWVMAMCAASRPPAPAHTPAATDTDTEDAYTVLEAKAAASSLPAAILREVYCRELSSSTAAPPPPHMSRPAIAHARVNSFIRLAQGDPSARTDDADLLSLLNC